MSETLNSIDLTIIIVVYLFGLLIIGMMSVKLRKMINEGCFPTNRGLNWILFCVAPVAFNISAIHPVGLAALGYNEGLV